MGIEILRNISYEDIYSDYSKVNLKDLIKGIPTEVALILICHFSAQLHTQNDDSEFQLNTLISWIDRFDENVRVKIKQIAYEIIVSKKSKFIFIDNVSSLYLIEALIINRNNLPILNDLSPLQEENLFKAYLYCTSKWQNEQNIIFKEREKSDLGKIYLELTLPYYEIHEIKDFRIQFLKAVYFFEFCESNSQFKSYIDLFFLERGFQNWNDYLFKLMSFYVSLFNNENIGVEVEFDSEDQDVYNSIKSLTIDTKSFKSVQDFISLRENPIYKLSNSKLLILNVNFLIDKIYHSIFFDLSKVLIDKGVTFKSNRIKKTQQFLGIIGNEFAEKGLFYKVMKKLFKQKDYSHFTGDELKLKFGDGSPDYLIIDNLKIYVFEFKNTLFSGNVKYSYNYSEIEKELEKKIVKNDDGKFKGVTQLAQFILEFKQKEKYKSLTTRDPSNYIVYPVLLITDFTFTLPVIYQIIETKLREALIENGAFKSSNIKKLTIVDLDSLIKFQDLFIQKRLTLNHVFEDYQLFLSKGINEVDKSLSFSKYLHLKAKKIKYDPSQFFINEFEK
ncbi:hypothetical protein PQG22_09315 [Aquirufa beregesia]